MEQGKTIGAETGASAGEAARLVAVQAMPTDGGADSALWARLSEAPDATAASRAWLAVQCRLIGPDAAGVVLVAAPDGRLLPTATVPESRPADPAFLRLAELAMREKRGVVGGAAAGRPSVVAYPVLLGETVAGAVAIASTAEIAGAMRQLQWGVAFLRDRFRRDAAEKAANEEARARLVLDLLGAVLECERYRAAAITAVTELALRAGCDRVSLGFLRRGSIRVDAISHSANFGKQMNLVRLVGAAMDEAVDQRAVIPFPLDADDVPLATRAHEALAEAVGGRLLTVPMLVRDAFLGAITFERPADKPFSREETEMLQAAAAALGPVLEEKRLNDRFILSKIGASALGFARRLFGPRHAGLKLGAAAIVLVAVFLSFATGRYEVTANATIEGLMRRAVVAPTDGFIKEAPARAGDRVKAGDLLAALEDRDLTLERLRWSTERQQRQLEYDRAFAERARASLNVIRAQIDQAEAQIRLIDEQLARVQLRAPFDALVVAGDLSQSIGAAVSRGQPLFELAPLDGYRVNLAVDESQIGDIALGQGGSVLLAAVPDAPFPFSVDKITPVAEAKGGRTVFRVEARLDGAPERLRPGMEGIAKVEIDRRRLAWIWSRSFQDWFRIAVWRWLR